MRNNKYPIFNNIIIIAALLAGTQLPLAALAHAETPVTHGNITRNYARITFEWPEPVTFTANADGTTLSITFDHKANPDFGPLLANLYPYVTRAERKADGKTVVLHLDKPYRIRTFVSDTINGIDLLNIDVRQKHSVASKTAAVKAPVKEVKVSDAMPKPSAATLAALAPAAGSEKPEEPKKAPAPAAPPAISTSPAPAAEMSDSAALAAHAVTTETRMLDPKAPIKVSISPAKDSAVLRFPFAERSASAVFIRGHMLWIVFNKAHTVDISEFDNMPATVITKPAVLANENATILRMPVADNLYVSVAKEENSFDWAVLITPAKRPLLEPIAITVNTDPPAPANVFVPALEMADPITVTDPDIGDDLVITPLFKLGEGMATDRDFVEFSLLQSAEGVIVHKKADDVAVTPLRNGMRIAMPQGATLTPGLPSVQRETEAQPLQSSNTLFPYDLWKPDSAITFHEELRLLFSRSVLSENIRDANDARLRMAQIYMSEGMAPEALAEVDGIYRTNPAYYHSAKISAIRGAANFMMYRFSDAARDFAASELNNNKETDYWRSMLSELLGNPDQNYDYMALNDDYISKYPPSLRQRLAIVAADRSIASKNYNMALKIFDTLHKDNQLESINGYANFLMAKISSETGQEKEALEMWDKLATDSDHPFVQARAEFSRIGWGLEHQELNKEKAIDRLERLRLGWHGDNLELNTATLLGDLYLERKDYINAMRIWYGLVTSFPNTAIAIDTTRKMQEAFIILFNEGGADSLPPLDALALYYQYRNYTPPGNTGNEMINHLADRLVSIDLLEQAAALLDHQMRFQTEKEQRSVIGAKLAAVYLANHQPKKALEALQESVYGENQLLVRLQRNRLTAQGMSDLAQYDKALLVLGQDESLEADNIRANIYWNQKDWTHVITSVEGLLKRRQDITAPINLAESEYLLKLAMAYVFENNTTQLQYLRDYFEPLMASNPNKPVFDFITSPDVNPNPTNFNEVMKYMADTRSFVDNYHARIQIALATPANQVTPPAKQN